MNKEKDRDVTEEEKFQVAAENVGRTGFGELRGNLTSMYGAPVEEVQSFPKDQTPLEMRNWYNYSLKEELPNFVSSSVEENRRVWQEMDVERMLDHHPTHEVHPSELPDYHYWPMIQNELNHKSSKETITTAEFRDDATYLPRFFKTGVPKTPVQEQDWYIPLKSDGRFNWRENIRKNGYTASLFDKRGWDLRYHVPINRPFLPVFLTGMRQFAQMPIYFKQYEIPLEKRLIRHISGSTFDRHFIFITLYCGFLASTAAATANWKELNWDFEPWNYDIAFLKTNRNQGGYHGIV